ncbi:hypothetical protein [Rhodanobacter caeni]|jgi:hypothetical protein|uniref:KfrA N-terminal DNA-binding domain-containing protein n=1 Tax=Rhodanobacter caeni TaxID=657654 RepID=A0ABN0UV92_9GAMM
MSDTIELLEAIGNDASLRHAPRQELASRLQQLGASPALTAAASSGHSEALYAELGHMPMQQPQVSHTPGHEDDETGQDDVEPPMPAPPVQGAH